MCVCTHMNTLQNCTNGTQSESRLAHGSRRCIRCVQLECLTGRNMDVYSVLYIHQSGDVDPRRLRWVEVSSSVKVGVSSEWFQACGTESGRQCRLVLLCWGSFVPFAVQCPDTWFSHWWLHLSSVVWTTVTRHWPVFLNIFFGGFSQWWMQLLD